MEKAPRPVIHGVVESILYTDDLPRAFAGMNDTELKALWAFLRTVPAVATGVR